MPFSSSCSHPASIVYKIAPYDGEVVKITQVVIEQQSCLFLVSPWSLHILVAKYCRDYRGGGHNPWSKGSSMLSLVLLRDILPCSISEFGADGLLGPLSHEG